MNARKVRENVSRLLEQYPQTRENDAYLIWLYWKYFDNQALPFLPFEQFYKMTAAETITRRRRELNEKGELLPSSPVLEHRERMSRRGRITEEAS